MTSAGEAPRLKHVGEPAVPREDIEWRIGRLRERVRGTGLHAVLALQKVEILYFSGTPQDGLVWIPSQGEPVFLVRRDLARARIESPMARIVPFRRPSDIPLVLAEHGVPVEGPVGTSLDVLPWKLHASLSRAIGVPIEDASKEVRETRSTKSAWERERVREAGELADALFGFVRAAIRPGMREIDLAAEINAFLLRAGSVAYYRTRSFNMEFPTLCSIAGDSGDWRSSSDSPNSAGRGPDPAFGQGPSDREIRTNEPILVDVGTNRHGYYADTTRVFHFGTLPRRFQEAHALSEEILSVAVDRLERSVPLSEVFADALGRAGKAGLEDAFMGGARFLGHGVGLEIDEWPVVADGWDRPLEDGAVLALEPKFALPGGIVGVETTFVFEEGHLRPVVTYPTAPTALD